MHLLGEDTPPKPPDFELFRWFDLSPMRPDAFRETIAMDWHEAVTLRNAIADGEEHAASDKRAFDKVNGTG
jgi:hypothetical protein